MKEKSIIIFFLSARISNRLKKNLFLFENNSNDQRRREEWNIGKTSMQNVAHP